MYELKQILKNVFSTQTLIGLFVAAFIVIVIGLLLDRFGGDWGFGMATVLLLVILAGAYSMGAHKSEN